MFKIPTFSQSTGMVTPRKAAGQLSEAQRTAKRQAADAAAQLAQLNKRMAEQSQRMRDMQANTQNMTPPAAQEIALDGEDERKRRMGGSRGSLLAGNTGGYNPATGGGRLGGMRSLLG
jgi:hypothetical protein